MHEAIGRMFSKYDCRSLDDHVNALREILQEVALLGLWRGKFFEKSAFYGGTALRILHGSDRFSEDLDFSLLAPAVDFDLGRYVDFAKRETEAFGFDMRVELAARTAGTPIQSALLKANARNQLLAIGAEEGLIQTAHREQIIKIKLEVDTDPPSGFSTQTQYLLQPISFALRAFSLPDLFAGKMHAILCRNWQNRAKGRDWYDLVWYVANHPELHLHHLEKRMRQTGHWKENAPLSSEAFRERLGEAILGLDVSQARREVEPFLKEPESLSVWSQDFFLEISSRIEYV